MAQPGSLSERPRRRPHDGAPGRDNPEVRRRLSGPAMRTFLNVCAAWKLSVNQQRGLLGWPAASTYHKYKTGQIGTLSFDALNRISLVLGIYKALHILYPQAELADRWVQLRNTNPIFGGKPPLELMIDGGIDQLNQIRRLLDGRRGA
jgi:Antitoxin Xre-like helix-turn-helix domain/Antitoxin Xre/MbcA/ParS C-terminal toxin-binding domain